MFVIRVSVAEYLLGSAVCRAALSRGMQVTSVRSVH